MINIVGMETWREQPRVIFPARYLIYLFSSMLSFQLKERFGVPGARVSREMGKATDELAEVVMKWKKYIFGFNW